MKYIDIEIKKLSPDLAEDYIRFFDEVPHGDCADENKCYCVTWRNDDTYVGNGDHWYPTREERKKRAVEFVKNGAIQGYIAYKGGVAIGWCNSSADCMLGVEALRSFGWPIEENRSEIKIKSIFCFAIAPDARRTGVAVALVDRICRDAAAGGFDFVESYPNKSFTTALDDMRGPLEMYKKCGFSVFAENDDKIVMRKALR